MKRKAAATTPLPGSLIESFIELDSAMKASSLNLVDALTGIPSAYPGKLPVDEARHFPEDDVFDSSTGSQYFLHRHAAGNALDSVHIHFFQRWAPAELNLPNSQTISTHLAALELDALGEPHAWFVVNQWVVGDYWQSADETIRLFSDWKIATPEEDRGNEIPELCHQWLSAYLKLNLASTIYPLLRERDDVLDKLIDAFPGVNVLEGRAHEVLGYQLIGFNAQLNAWKKAL